MKSSLTSLAMIVAAAMLSGCQSTDDTVSTEPVKADKQTCEVAHTEVNDGEDCGVAKEGVIEVMHPIEEVAVDIELEKPEKTETQPVSEPVEVTDVWQYIANGFEFTVPDNRRVNVQRDWYLKHPEYMARVVKRAKPFLHYIVGELEHNNMPMELALLPIVESAFDPFAYSHGRAAGMWQFIPGTAKRFGIQQTWWYDGRRDVIASTQGAVDYLTYLVEMFDGNWLHALAAYNSGEGRVARAIRANEKAGKPTDFWSLDLPRETRAYVPKLLALADILKNRDEYAFAWPSVDNNEVIAVVDIGSQVDLAFAAELAEMPLEALHALNPGFNRWATDPDGPHRLVLPIDKAETFSKALDGIDRNERLNWIRHKVKPGDSLLKLAYQYHTTADIIKRVNELDSNVIRIGDHVMVPVALKELDQYSLSQDQRLASMQNVKRGEHKLTHEVKSGDTLWELARKYKVSTRDLAKWNGMAPTDMLRPGQELAIWLNKLSEGQRPDSIMKTLTYTVRRGDSLSRIASKFNVRISDIAKWNDISAKRYLQPGQKLKLVVDVTRLKNVG
ncbi:LysM peptidoglycan-binding domain-containing protein [Alteromonas halophila]|uniref:Lytic transglycosylase n=1 Tax=Alteromonas halophila TaxID=516698 RepID=A0A918JQP9_9ALTE|nr:LysM peptidoglycan-binding domain-containing protein [Alteromonas halophila]GGW95276.1 lytic transglycosylase [Alteromonas halophila]